MWANGLRTRLVADIYWHSPGDQACLCKINDFVLGQRRKGPYVLLVQPIWPDFHRHSSNPFGHLFRFV